MAIEPKYRIGQKVVINPCQDQSLSPRHSGLEQYTGQTGEVSDYYSVNLDRGAKVFYIYAIKVGESYEEIVVHEDELEPLMA